MIPYAAITIALIMAVVSVSLANADNPKDPGPEIGNCPRPHEEWTPCGPPPGCIPTCDHSLQDRECGEVCVVVGCVCETGFIRAYRDGPCIPESDCPSVEHHDH